MEEIKKLRMLSLCAGIGGADLAAEATGHIEVVGQVEIDPFCQAVLEKHWPEVKRMSDIREVKGHEFGNVDIIVGGIPCQPHSLAGKRKSSADDRNLWPEFYRIICTIKPRWVVVENVLGLLSSEGGAFFGGILRDLADAGYDAEWHVLRASDVGAPHERKRVFLVAYSGLNRCGLRQSQHQRLSECHTTPNLSHDGSKRALAHAQSGNEGRSRVRDEETLSRLACDGESMADPTSQRLPLWGSDGLSQNTAQNAAGMVTQLERCSALAHTDCQRREECNPSTRGNESRFVARRNDPTDRPGQSQPRIRRGTYGLPSRLDLHRWPARPGQPQKAGEPTRTITEKIPYRNQRLKALGNAIVPQQIKPIFDAIVYVEYMECVA